MSMVGTQCFAYIRLFTFYQKGFLPFSGSILEQPAKLVETFELLDDTLLEFRRENEPNG